ncbi:MAG: class I SAM-dependent methyltransferase [Cyanobacteria bacterium K_DeepCast_35m_m1_288]|nr:class I SAM-dependent methyltransferase [Cyanobacteria bacterium K_DeepCast_35m_m1_288]
MSQLISENQRSLNKALHSENQQFGNRPTGAGLATHLPAALMRMHELGLCRTVLDYGTGKGKLVHYLREKLPPVMQVDGYDPAVNTWMHKPGQPVDILTCLDVLEHIEMESIDAVLKDIKSLTRGFCFLIIDLQPAAKKLADGRNAHILLAPPEWWVGRISQLFTCQASFPVMHRSGHPQKLVVAATNNVSILPLVYAFLGKLKIFGIQMEGGPLGAAA